MRLYVIAALWFIVALGQMKNGEEGYAWAFASVGTFAIVVQVILDAIDENHPRR